MIKLETYVNEKLKITKSSFIPDLITLLESKDRKEFNSRYLRLLDYLRDDSYLPIAELENSNNGLKVLSTKYKGGYDTFLVVLENFIFYGTWDNMYYISWNISSNRVKNSKCDHGFSDFTTINSEISESGGIYIITENNELMEQIDYLMQKAE